MIKQKNFQEKGFTFIEVMVTMAILSLGLVLIYKTFLTSLDWMSHLIYRSHAMVILDNEIAEIEQQFSQPENVQSGPREEMINKAIHNKIIRFKCVKVISSVEKIPHLYQVDLSVVWQEGKRRVRISRSVYCTHLLPKEET